MRVHYRRLLHCLVTLLCLPACVNVPKFVPGQVDAGMAEDGGVDSDAERVLFDQGIEDAAAVDDAATMIDAGIASPSIQITASRASGVAPLLVHFAVEPEGSGLSQSELHRAEYRWALGDGALQRTSFEPVAIQIYDVLTADGAVRNHGDVEVSVTVTLPDDGGTFRASTTVRIEHPDDQFDGLKTVCYAQGIGDEAERFRGCPNGANQVTLSGEDLISEQVDDLDTLAGRRILFRRGQTFLWGAETVALAAVEGQKPTHIGAFGDGSERPTLQYSGTEYILDLAGAHDVRIQSLAFELPRTTDPQPDGVIFDIKPIVVSGTSRQILIDDTYMLGIRSEQIDGEGPVEALADSAITRSWIAPRLTNGDQLSEINLKVNRFAFVENQVMGRENSQETDASHVNISTGASLLVRNNQWSAREGGVADSLMTLQLILLDRCPPSTIIADNHFTGGTFNQIVDLVPDGQYGDNPCRGYVYFERNQLTWRDGLNFVPPATERRAMVTLGTQGAMIRNNIFDFGPLAPNDETRHVGILSTRGVDDGGFNQIAQNTFIVGDNVEQRSDLGNRVVYAVDLGSDNAADNAVVANNLLLAPDAAGEDTIWFSDQGLDNPARGNHRYNESWPFGVESLSSESDAETYRLRPAIAEQYSVERLREVVYDFGGACRRAMTQPGAWADSDGGSDGACTPQIRD